MRGVTEIISIHVGNISMTLSSLDEPAVAVVLLLSVYTFTLADNSTSPKLTTSYNITSTIISDL